MNADDAAQSDAGTHSGSGSGLRSGLGSGSDPDSGSGSGSGQGAPSHDISTWSIERLRAFTEQAEGGRFEAVRVVAQGHAYDPDRSPEARRRWAEVSLRANRRLNSDSAWIERVSRSRTSCCACG